MVRLRSTALAGAAIAAIAWVPSAPAVAGVPFFFAPWALSHIVAPIVVGAALSVFQPPAPYPAAPYYGAPAAYYSPAYGQQPGYYGPPAPYYYPRGGYYGHAPSYRPAYPGGYPLPRGAYPKRLPYHASYGGNQAFRSGGYARRGW